MIVSAVLTAHREGLLAGPSVGSFREALDDARSHGITVEALVVLDRPDELTLSILGPLERDGARIVMTDYGDPAEVRNRGVAESAGTYVTFLDGDDLWSFNWITAAHAFLSHVHPRTVAHSEINLIFGATKQIWVHADGADPNVDLDYMRIGNYWDALCMVRRDIIEEIPIRKNDLKCGFGHEDWHWNCLTLQANCIHRPVPGTVHMKRRRRNSQSALANDHDVVVWPDALPTFEAGWQSAR